MGTTIIVLLLIYFLGWWSTPFLLILGIFLIAVDAKKRRDEIERMYKTNTPHL